MATPLSAYVRRTCNVSAIGLLLGCLAGAASAQSRVPVTCDPTDRAIESCNVDSSVEADYAQLQDLVKKQMRLFGGEAFTAKDVKIAFTGRARTTSTLLRSDAAEGRVDDSTNPGTPKELRSDVWRLFNPATRNEFQLATPAALRVNLHDQLMQKGQTRPTTGRTGDGGGTSPDPSPPTAGPGRGIGTEAWSGGNDSRVRNTATTSWPWRTIADMGGCTATFIGPRHIVTAGHCLYSRTNSAWGTSFTVVPGRDTTTQPYGSTSMPPVAGQTGWYFTPAGYRQASPAGGASQYDFGIVVVPDRLGDTVGWMGYGTLTADSLRAGSIHLLRGYPFCESETSGTGERIDEPSPCVVNGFYVGDSCTVKDFSKLDGDNWNRRVTHGCDASAANSGSAIYSYQTGFGPFVSMIHTTSLKCAFPGDSACTSADTHPLQATRLTPEYTGWVSYFRSMFP